eukprot:CAMPEP_0198730592 /NCGR_PEP_ID=MMETSP1475-20131203/25218_1 /TAXON_ID= ORGANISM="Unidentified sp., Strain CCMP1999" /NCGR_SAMPLE_ID=MMETSP1475 /ASSEMBLY_ACC=CAM_ASM_001111 /LENGTH=122 /DNA_ID=CAMNT_0044493413 /DNA_START=24 /DNA_END=392 /DNA_ORIENTATION=+
MGRTKSQILRTAEMAGIVDEQCIDVELDEIDVLNDLDLELKTESYIADLARKKQQRDQKKRTSEVSRGILTPVKNITALQSVCDGEVGPPGEMEAAISSSSAQVTSRIGSFVRARMRLFASA